MRAPNLLAFLLAFLLQHSPWSSAIDLNGDYKYSSGSDSYVMSPLLLNPGVAINDIRTMDRFVFDIREYREGMIAVTQDDTLNSIQLAAVLHSANERINRHGEVTIIYVPRLKSIVTGFEEDTRFVMFRHPPENYLPQFHGEMEKILNLAHRLQGMKLKDVLEHLSGKGRV